MPEPEALRLSPAPLLNGPPVYYRIGDVEGHHHPSQATATKSSADSGRTSGVAPSCCNIQQSASFQLLGMSLFIML
jgi:hypothetical protein